MNFQVRGSIIVFAALAVLASASIFVIRRVENTKYPVTVPTQRTRAERQFTTDVAELEAKQRAYGLEPLPLPRPEQPAKKAPTVKAVDALTVAWDYLHDEMGADARYKGRQVVIVGTIMSIDPAPEGKWAVVLAMRRHAIQEEVRCIFNARFGNLASYLPGDLVTLEGRCGGLSRGSVLVHECSVKKP